MFRSGFGIGRWFGINVRVDWSWLLIFGLISTNLAYGFADLHPDWPSAQRWILAIIAALIFFLSVLAHELAHSIIARSRGLPVKNIVLFLFGGVSNIQREPESPGTEFLVAIVGPLTSIVIGVVLSVLAGASVGPLNLAINNPIAIVSQMGPITTMFLWLGAVNIILGLFNMVPAFPLDGGRVLRSIIWAVSNNLRNATWWATTVGRLIAWAMIAGGIAMIFGARLPFFGQGLFNGLWLVFIGWFLNSASVQSYQQVIIQDILGDVPVSRIMRQNPPSIAPESSVSELVNSMMAGDDYAYPVLSQTRLIGLVTMDDVRRVPRPDWDRTRVQEVMTPMEKLVTVSTDEDAAEAFVKLSQRDVRQLPVLFNGNFVGLLRRRDVMRWLQLHSESSARV